MNQFSQHAPRPEHHALFAASPSFTSLPIDLHCHSTCSDGSFAPSEVVRRAHANGVHVLALTDHDSVAGLTEAHQTAAELGMTLLNGVEISCRHRVTGGYSKKSANSQIVLHVLGYGFDDTDTMHARLSVIQDQRERRGYAICQKIAAVFKRPVDELWQAVLTKAQHNPKAVGRTHLASTMVDFGMVKDVQSAFSHYLADYKPCYVPLDGLSLTDTVRLIHACGGKASLAHPTRYGLSATKVRNLLADFAKAGGDAVELPASNEPPSTRHMIDRAIAAHGLRVSVGSDFHGTTMPWRVLGQVPKLHDGQVGIWQLI